MPFSEGAFQRHLNTIAANRQGYSSGFRPGSQTLDGRKFDEDRRQFDLSLADTQQARKADALRQAMEFNEKRRQFGLTYNLSKQNAALDLASSASKPTSVKPGNNELFADTIESMLAGATRHREAIIAGEKRNPHNYNYYPTTAIKLARESGMPLSNAEVEKLMETADKFSKADAEWQVGRGKDGDVIEMNGKKYKWNPDSSKYEPI